jgi:hypothetical protein
MRTIVMFNSADCSVELVGLTPFQAAILALQMREKGIDRGVEIYLDDRDGNPVFSSNDETDLLDVFYAVWAVVDPDRTWRMQSVIELDDDFLLPEAEEDSTTWPIIIEVEEIEAPAPKKRSIVRRVLSLVF